MCVLTFLFGIILRIRFVCLAFRKCSETSDTTLSPIRYYYGLYGNFKAFKIEISIEEPYMFSVRSLRCRAYYFAIYADNVRVWMCAKTRENLRRTNTDGEIFDIVITNRYWSRFESTIAALLLRTVLEVLYRRVYRYTGARPVRAGHIDFPPATAARPRRATVSPRPYYF